MQYWIFPLVGFVSLTWNRNSNLIEIMDFKKKDLNMKCSCIESLPPPTFRVFPPEERGAGKIHWIQSVSSKNQLNKRMALGKQMNFSLIPQKQHQNKKSSYKLSYNLKLLEHKLLMLENGEKKTPLMDKGLMCNMKKTKNFQLIEKSNFLKFPNNFPLKNTKDFRCVSNPMNNNVKKFNKSINEIWSSDISFDELLKRKPLIFSKEKIGPKKFFPYATHTSFKPVLINLDSSFRREGQRKEFPFKNLKEKKKIIFNLIETMNSKNFLKENFSKNPIYSYEKAKNFLDNAIKNSILVSNEQKYEENSDSLIPIYSLEKLKNENFLSQKNLKNSKLLLSFSILKKNQLIEMKNLKNFVIRKKRKNSKNVQFLKKISSKNSFDKNLGEISNIKNKNLSLKIVTEKLKFDLERFFLSKKYQSNKQKNFFTMNQFLDKKLILPLLPSWGLGGGDFMFKMNPYFSLKIKKFKKNFLVIKKANLKNAIYELTVLNSYKNRLKILDSMDSIDFREKPNPNLMQKSLPASSLRVFPSEERGGGRDSKSKNFNSLIFTSLNENFLEKKNLSFPIQKNFIGDKKYLRQLMRIEKIFKNFKEKPKNFLIPENLNDSKNSAYHFLQFLTTNAKKDLKYELKNGIKLRNQILKPSKKNVPKIFEPKIDLKNFLEDFSSKNESKERNLFPAPSRRLGEGHRKFFRSYIQRKSGKNFFSKGTLFFFTKKEGKKFLQTKLSFGFSSSKSVHLIESPSKKNFQVKNLLEKNVQNYPNFYKKFSFFIKKITALFSKELDKKREILLKNHLNHNLLEIKEKFSKNKPYAKNKVLVFFSKNQKLKKRLNKKILNPLKLNPLKKSLNKKEKIFRSLLSYKASENSFFFCEKKERTFFFCEKKESSFENGFNKKKENFLKILKKKMKKTSNNKKRNQFYKKKIAKNQSLFLKSNEKKFFRLKNQISLNQILRRIGFVFLYDFKIEQNFSKSKEFHQYLRKNEEKLIFFKEKEFQKKRRRKKLKLENRRRKKRKRFYPRPIWLRYSLYKKYLKFRHPSNANFSSFQYKPKFKNKNFDPFIVSEGKYWDSKKANEKTGNFLYNFEQSLQTKIYRKKKQKWGNFIQDTPFIEKTCLKKGNFLSVEKLYNKEYYKVSNVILSEFQPLCWKSYWFRSNLNPYMNRIQKNFTRMKEMEKIQNKSYIFSFLSKAFGFFPYDYSISKKQMLPYAAYQNLIPFYSDFKNSFDNQHIFYASNFFLMERINKIAEYNRIEYERFSEIIKNIKYNMNLDGQQKPKSAKFSAWKYLLGLKELKASNKTNFWRNFSSNFQPNLSKTSPFVIFSNPFSKNSLSIKPYGSSATLRTLWAFNKTNVFSFKSQNFIRNLWEKTKLREQLKSNQTRKFFTNVFKKKSEGLMLGITNKTSDSLKLHSQKSLIGSNKNFSKNFSIATKLNHSNMKLAQIGFFKEKPIKKYFKNKEVIKHLNIPYKNSLFYYKKIAKLNEKIQTKSNFVFRKNIFIKSQKPHFSKKDFVESFPLLNGKKPRLIFSSPNFWWTSKNFQIPFQLNPLSKNLEKNLRESSGIDCSYEELISDFKKLVFYNLFLFSILFHFCLFLSINRIPEVRGVLKFQILLFYKISNNCFFGLYKIYDLVKKYQEEISKTYYSLYIKTSKLLIEMNLLDSKLMVLENLTPFLALNMEKNSRTPQQNQIHFQTLFYSINKNQKKPINTKEFLYPYIFYNLALIDKNQLINCNQLIRFKNFSKKKQWTGLLNYPKISQKDFKPCQKKRNEKLLAINKIPSNKHFVPFLSYIESKDPFISSSSIIIEQVLFTKKIFGTFKNYCIKKNFKFNKRKFGKNFSLLDKKILSGNKLLLIKFALYFSFLSYGFASLSIGLFEFSYQMLLKILDFFESILFLIYKFLEKPAELMIEWIAQIFLIEWSSDLSTFIPETFDMYFWTCFQKFFHNSRILSFFEFQSSSNLSINPNFYKIENFNENSILSSNFLINQKFGLIDFSSSNNFLGNFLSTKYSGIALGFFIQRRLWHFFHFFMDSFYKPDIDLMIRQKKGKIFWDIWAEILIRAAEEYNINIPSLTSLKEEQEKLIERLIQDPNFTNFSVLKNPKNLKNIDFLNSSYKIPSKSIFLSLKSSKKLEFKEKKFEGSNLFHFNGLKSFYKTKTWATNQSLTFNLKDTDLFLDLSPPKSFKLSVPFIHGYEPIQYTLGSILCEIYSGIFSKKVSKNLLIVHSQAIDFPVRASLSSSFFKNQSIEFQSKTNYGSLIIQALAGEAEIKIMIDNARRYSTVQRGVAIGMKLLRDVFESIVFQTPCFFLMEDIHKIGERRPMLISDDENSYEKEFSIFGFEQDEESEKNQMIYQSNRHSITDYRKPYKGDFSTSIPTNLYEKNFYSFKTFSNSKKPIHQKKYPIPLSTINKTLSDQANSNENQLNKKIFNISRLEILSENFFAPPATSPFTILMMKEQRKFKPKKIPKQAPWNSFVSENILEQKKDTLRVKVAILADIALQNFSYQKDMITDLLVIIDGVRSNRGFVVFATTHLPSLLDPALRRPGRFDETISLPFLPNLTNRWSLFIKDFPFQNFPASKGGRERISKDSFDRFNYGMLTENFSFEQISNLIKKSKFSINIHQNYSLENKKFKPNSKILGNPCFYERNTFINFNNKRNMYLLNSPISKPNFQIHPNQSMNRFFIESFNKTLFINSKNLKKIAKTKISFGYYQVGHFLVGCDFLKDQKGFSLINKSSLLEQSSSFVFETLLTESKMFQTFLMKLLGGKIAEFLGTSCLFQSIAKKNQKKIEKFALNFNFSYQDHMIRYKSWHFATSLIFSVLQKRFLYKKNFTLFKMLLLDNPNQSSLKEPPSPPSSKILMPSKKYENFKRLEQDFQKKAVFSIFEKMQIHQKQRFLKKLYNKPIIEKFQSQLFLNRLTSFDSCFKEFSYNKNSILLSSSSSYPYYKNRLHLKHRFSLINQWWNGQLAEHNVEATYLSDIDWRTMYIKSNNSNNIFTDVLLENQSIKKSVDKKQKMPLTRSNDFSSKKFDYVFDFPDADQHYNPLKRRWFLNTNAWNYWLTFETNIYYDAYFHMIYDSFNKTFSYFNQNREFLDFFLYTYNIKHSLKEADLLFIFSRFYRT